MKKNRWLAKTRSREATVEVEKCLGKSRKSCATFWIDLVVSIAGAIPETPGVYVFSLGLWKRSPADLLYLGSGHNLLQRVGENVACALGFWSETVGRSQGGWKLSAEYCRQNGGRNPLDLDLGWLLLPKNVCPVPCERKLHARHYHKLSPLLLNKERVLPCARESVRKACLR